MIVSEPVKVPIRAVADEREKLFPRDECSRVNRFGRSPIAPPYYLTTVVKVLNATWRFVRAFDNANKRYEAGLPLSLWQRIPTSVRIVPQWQWTRFRFVYEDEIPRSQLLNDIPLSVLNPNICVGFTIWCTLRARPMGCKPIVHCSVRPLLIGTVCFLITISLP